MLISTKQSTILIALFGLFALISDSAAQLVDSVWSRTYGSSRSEGCWRVIIGNDSSLVVIGLTEGLGNGSTFRSDIYLLRVSQEGQTLLETTFGGLDDDYARDVLPIDGGYLIAGVTKSFTNSQPIRHDFWLISVSESGDSLWSHSYGTELQDICSRLLPTSNGEHILIGYSNEITQSISDGLIIRVDANGDSLWGRVVGGAQNDVFSCGQIALNGDILAAGWTASHGSGRHDFWLCRFSPDGDSIWSRTYGGDDDDYCYDLLLLQDGSFILAGNTESQANGRNDAWIVHVDSTGELLWERKLGGVDGDAAWRIITTADSNLIFVGYTESFGNGELYMPDLWLVKLSFEGDSIWSTSFGGPFLDAGYSLVQLTDRSYVVAGLTWQPGQAEDGWLIRTTPDTSEATSITKRELYLLPNVFRLRVMPNPFNPTTTISFDFLTTTNAKLSVHNLIGQQIAVLANETLVAGHHDIVFDGSQLPSGIYFVHLESSGLQTTQKVVLLK